MLRLLLLAVAWLALLPLTVLRFGLSKLKRRRLCLLVDLEGRHPSRPPTPTPLRPGRVGISRRALSRTLGQAAEDPRIDLVRVRLGALAGGWAELYELRRGLLDLRAAGKRVVAFVAHADTRGLWVASAADEVLLSPDVPVPAAGVSAEVMFYGEALARAGLDMEVVTAGAFKSALEGLSRSAPSDPNRAAVEALLDGLYAGVVTDVAAARGMSPDAARAALEAGPSLPPDALEAGLADALVAEDDLPEHLGYHPDGALTPVSAARYRGAPGPWPKFRWRRPRLALVEVAGTIRDGRHDDPHPSGATVAAVCGALEAARKDKRVRGVLLHVDSRGGSATASERMWRAARKLADEKPVVVWMGDAAASGGYYVACAAHRVYAAPGTLTGSIGVLFGKPVAERLLERLGVGILRLERGGQAGMFSASRRFGPSERAAAERMVEHYYQLFLRRVAESRERSPEDVHPVAQGRVWSGAQALEHRLVDELGSERDALEELKRRVGLEGEQPVRLFAPRRSVAQRVRAAFGAEAPQLFELLQVASEPAPMAWCPVRLE